MQLHKSLRLFTAVIVTGSGTFAYLSCLFSVIDRLEIKVQLGISTKFWKCYMELFGSN